MDIEMHSIVHQFIAIIAFKLVGRQIGESVIYFFLTL